MADDRTALHEAGHSWMALRCGWVVRLASVNGGAYSDGAVLHDAPPLAGTVYPDLPFALWPSPVRDGLTHRAMVTMAGEISECLLYAQADIPLAVRAADLAAELPADLPPPDDDDLLTLASKMDDPGEPADQLRLAEYACRAHRGDHMSASSWLAHLADQVVALVATDQAKIEALAARLAEAGELSGDAIAAILAA